MEIKGATVILESTSLGTNCKQFYKLIVEYEPPKHYGFFL